jgi:hypothetical protein
MAYSYPRKKGGLSMTIQLVQLKVALLELFVAVALIRLLPFLVLVAVLALCAYFTAHMTAEFVGRGRTFLMALIVFIVSGFSGGFWLDSIGLGVSAAAIGATAILGFIGLGWFACLFVLEGLGIYRAVLLPSVLTALLVGSIYSLALNAILHDMPTLASYTAWSFEAIVMLGAGPFALAIVGALVCAAMHR